MADASENTSFFKLLKTREFLLYWSAGLLSSIGDHFDLLAFPWLVIVLTGDPLAVGAVLALGNAPTILFMLVGGSLVDRFTPRLIMLTSNGVRVVMGASLAAVILWGHTHLWLILLISLLKGAADAFYHPGHAAMLPRIVPISHLRQANAVMRTTSDISGLVGPVLGGMIIAFFSESASPDGGANTDGIALAFAVVAIIFFISFLLLASMQSERFAPESRDQLSEEKGMLQSLIEGIRFVRTVPAILTVFLLVAGVEFLIEGPVIVGVPILADLRLPEGVLAVGVVTAGFAIGSILGAISAGTLPAPRRGLGPIAVTLFAVSGVLLMPFGFQGSMWMVACLAVCMGVVGAYVDVLLVSWLQSRTPQVMMGRTMSLLMIAEVGLQPISIAVAAPLIKLSLEWTFICAGALIVLFCSVVFFRGEVRGMSVQGQ